MAKIGLFDYVKNAIRFSPNRSAGNSQNTPGAKGIIHTRQIQNEDHTDVKKNLFKMIDGGKRKSSSTEYPALVKQGVISYHWYKNYKDTYKVPNVRPSRIHTWKSKEEQNAHIKKIQKAIVYLTKGWFGTNRCDDTNLEVEYPYFNMRTCLPIKKSKPLPIPSKKFLNELKRQIGGPLYMAYYFDDPSKTNNKIFYDSN